MEALQIEHIFLQIINTLHISVYQYIYLYEEMHVLFYLAFVDTLMIFFTFCFIRVFVDK